MAGKKAKNAAGGVKATAKLDTSLESRQAFLKTEQEAAFRAASSTDVRDGAAIEQLGVTLGERMSRASAQLRTLVTAPNRIECGEGCTWCCHVLVLAAPFEVVRIAEHLRATLDANALADVTSRVVEVDARTRGVSQVERFRGREACPLLVDDRCSIYAVRPLACAGLTSIDRAACKTAYDRRDPATRVPFFNPERDAARALVTGASNAMRNVETAPVELNAALAIALQRANASERWRSGFHVFSQARYVPDGTEVR